AFADFPSHVLARRQRPHRHGPPGKRGVLVLRANAGHELLMEAGTLQILNDSADAYGLEALDHTIRALPAEDRLQLRTDAYFFLHGFPPCQSTVRNARAGTNGSTR